MLNKNKFKILIFLFLALAFTSFSFAVGEAWTQDTGFFHNFVTLISAIVDLLSLVWFVLPIIAGKLLTNDFVYGTFMHMDVVLWKIWNFSRSFANFIIGFIFIFATFKYLVSLNDKNADVLKNYLPKIAIWAIVVNASWFIIWVLIDISTLLIAAFGSLPGYIWQHLNEHPEKVNLALVTDYKLESWCKKSEEKYCLWGFTIDANTKEQKVVSLNDILKYESNISGPLVFLMNSIVDITSVSKDFRDQALSNNSKIYTDWGAFMKAILRILVIILFMVPLFVLIIVNLVRIFYLWLYVGFSPLIFLDNIFGWKTIASKPAFKFSNMIWLIFQPAIVVAAFSLWFIFLVNIIWVVDKSTSDKYKKYEKWVLHTFNLTGSSAGVIDSDYFQFQDATQKMSKYVWGFFGYLFIMFLSIALVWSLIKLSFKASEITSNIADRAFNFTEEMLKTVPAIPTPWWAQSVGSLEKFAWEIAALPTTVQNKQAQRLEKIFDTVMDIDPTHKAKYLDSLNNIESNLWSIGNLDKDNLDKVFEQFEKYSGRENLIKWNKNTLELLNKVVEILKKKAPSYATKLKTKWVDDMLKETDLSRKLKILLSNETDAKKILLNEK